MATGKLNNDVIGVGVNNDAESYFFNLYVESDFYLHRIYIKFNLNLGKDEILFLMLLEGYEKSLYFFQEP